MTRTGGNIADTARVFGINRPVVYDILKKAAEGGLRDRSRVPKHQPNKTPPEIEEQVVQAKNKTHKGYRWLSIHPRKYEGIYYKNVRSHSSLNYQPPFSHLKQQQPHVDDHIRYVQPFMLDQASVALGPWSGYNVLAQHLFCNLGDDIHVDSIKQPFAGI